VKAIHINTADDLELYGLNALTGEADAYMERILFDLNQEGVDLLTEYLGGNVSFTEGSNWNSKVNGQPAVASIMMPWDWVRSLVRYILFRVNGCPDVYQNPDGFAAIGVQDPESEVGKMYAEASEDYGLRRYRNPCPGSTSGRNTHQFTGRTV